MVIGIISDTHRNQELHAQVLDQLTQEKRAEKIYHLGDCYADGELEWERGLDITQVPGRQCAEFTDKSIEKTLSDAIQGFHLLLTHERGAITEKDLVLHDVFLYGHTHKFELEFKGGKLYLNPGHLKSDMDKGRPPSYGLLNIDAGELRASIFQVDGKKLLEMTFRKGAVGLQKQS